MVFSDVRGQGCDRCRDRKIKCDGRRPGCKRCEAYKALCPGYDRPLPLRFHAKSGRRLVRREAGAGRTSAQTTFLKKVSNRNLSTSRCNGLEIARQPQPSFEDECFAYFLHEYAAYPVPDATVGPDEP